MRLALPLIALMLTSAAAAENLPDPTLPQTVDRVSPPDGVNIIDRTTCRDRIHLVREERGLPQLDRSTASPEASLIAAVDHRIDGCSVMVMYNNTSDIRPVPTMPDGPPRLQRIPER